MTKEFLKGITCEAGTVKASESHIVLFISRAVAATSFPGSLFSASLATTKGGREERPWERGCRGGRVVTSLLCLRGR